MPKRAMIIVAGGSSERFGSDKLAADIGGRPLLHLTIEQVADSVDELVVVCRPQMIGSLDRSTIRVARGGATRTESEMAGLAAVSSDIDLIGIHDGARPLVSPSLVERLFAAAGESAGAVPVLPPPRPLVARDSLRAIEGAAVVQTPQVFPSSILRATYASARADGFSGHDTADIVSRYSDLTIRAVAGDPGNIKVTFPEDLEWVRSQIRT